MNVSSFRRGAIDSWDAYPLTADVLNYYLLHDYDKRVKEKLDEHPGKWDGTRSEIGSMEALSLLG